MKTPLCPNCGKELVFCFNADVKYTFNEKTGLYDLCEVDSIGSHACDWCGKSPWSIWEDDDTTDIYEVMNRITPSHKFMIVQGEER